MINSLAPLYFGIIMGICLLSILILTILIILSFRKNYKIKQMYTNVWNQLENIINLRKLKDSTTLKISEDKAYDFYLESRTHIYYIKVVPNFKNDEICVNNKTKWQIIRNMTNANLFVENIDGLMNLDISYPTKKIIRKLYIIYPNANVLLKYINECEIVFIYPDTDVYGCNVITYQNLIEHPECIEGK